jgi:hypothetical protein
MKSVGLRLAVHVEVLVAMNAKLLSPISVVFEDENGQQYQAELIGIGPSKPEDIEFKPVNLQ